jgi:hypothetical protein
LNCVLIFKPKKSFVFSFIHHAHDQRGPVFRLRCGECAALCPDFGFQGLDFCVAAVAGLPVIRNDLPRRFRTHHLSPDLAKGTTSPLLSSMAAEIVTPIVSTARRIGLASRCA